MESSSHQNLCSNICPHQFCVTTVILTGSWIPILAPNIDPWSLTTTDGSILLQGERSLGLLRESRRVKGLITSARTNSLPSLWPLRALVHQPHCKTCNMCEKRPCSRYWIHFHIPSSVRLLAFPGFQPSPRNGAIQVVPTLKFCVTVEHRR